MIKEHTKVYSRNLSAYLNDDIDLIINQGGTSSSKTYSILQILIDIAERSKKHRLISVVSESMPHIKKGVLTDFKNILGEEYNEKNHNKTDQIYRINKTDIEFFGVDDSGKVIGPRRDILFMNEINNIRKEIFDHMEVRTNEKIFLDFNPTHEFWVHDMINDKGVEFIKSTFIHNRMLNAKIKERILKRKDKDPNWWRVYGLGEIGKLEGLIFPHFKIINEMPESFKKERYGMDFGFTNDPTTLLHCGIIGDDLYIDQLLYRTGMTNKDISDYMTSLNLRKGYDEIIADCAEPKSIEELSRLGWFIRGCSKGVDSIINGIDNIKQLNINITQSSIETIKEFRNYRWKEDKDGRCINKPIDIFNHSIDGIRYAITDIFNDYDLQYRSLA